MQLSASEKRIVATVLKPDSALGTFASVTFKIWIVASLFLAGMVLWDFPRSSRGASFYLHPLHKKRGGLSGIQW